MNCQSLDMDGANLNTDFFLVLWTEGMRLEIPNAAGNNLRMDFNSCKNGEIYLVRLIVGIFPFGPSFDTSYRI